MNARTSPTTDINDYHAGVVQVVSAQGVSDPQGTPAGEVTYTVQYSTRDGRTATQEGVVPMYRATPPAPGEIDVDILPAPVNSIWPALFANNYVFAFIYERQAVGDCNDGGAGGLVSLILAMTPNDLAVLKARMAEVQP